MNIDRRLFRSKLARRVFLAFVFCALIPIGIVGIVSYRSVTDQLISQESSRLRQASKAVGLSVYERLLFAESELATVASLDVENRADELGRNGLERIWRIEIVDEIPHPSDDSEFRQRQRESHLAGGRSVLLPLRQESGATPIRLARRLDPSDSESKLLVGELDPIYLWGLESGNAVPAEAEFCVYESSGRSVFGSFEGCGEAWSAIHEPGDGSEGDVEAVFPVGSLSDELYVAGHRDLFLGARFGAPEWAIVVCEPLSVVVKPIKQWRFVFPAVMLLAFWVVLLLMIGAIRRNLSPIDRLHEATVHLAEQDFDFHVEVSTGDEFEELAGAFNRMSSRLRRQFSALAATGRVHRAILSSLDTSQIVRATLAGIVDYFECDLASVIVVADSVANRTSVSNRDGDVNVEEGIVLSTAVLSQLERVHPGSVIGHDLPATPELIAPLGMVEMSSVVAIPIFIRGEIIAVIGLGHRSKQGLPEEDLEHLTQLGDQFAVAISNARMLQEVNDFSLGTLEALARAVDAKSPWTAGHSERVTRLAVTIGSAYGLDPFELSKLHRGAILHDIGKLGISQMLLDKRGRLDEEEFNVVRSHTMIGERILEPVGAFADIMPVVTQHHERFDGTGYPNGLAGTRIDIKARILAVADVYDAMTNPRPYRDSVEPREVVEMIRSQAGSQFDPQVVEAFFKVIESRGGIEHLSMLKKDFSFVAKDAAGSRWVDESRETG